MKKMLVAAMLMSMWHVGNARAEVMADGTIAPSGNAAVNLAIAGFNVYRKAMNLEMEYTKFIEQRADIMKALAQKTAAARGGSEGLKKLKADLVTEESSAKKTYETAMRDARGDKAKEAAAETKYKARKEQLETARSQIDGAAADMKQVYDTGEQLRKNLEAIDTTDSVNGPKQWAELRKQNATVQKTMTERTKKVDAALSNAATALQQGSTVNKAELVGAFKVTPKLGGKKTDVFVNGVQIKDGVPFAVGKDGKIELRARIVDARRKQALDLEGKKTMGSSIKIELADAYHLKYNNGTRSSSWEVEKEVYEWKEPDARTGGLGVNRRSSGNGVKGDILEITIPADTYSNTIRTFVTGEISWKGPTVDSDAEGATIELQIEPGKK